MVFTTGGVSHVNHTKMSHLEKRSSAEEAEEESDASGSDACNSQCDCLRKALYHLADELGGTITVRTAHEEVTVEKNACKGNTDRTAIHNALFEKDEHHDLEHTISYRSLHIKSTSDSSSSEEEDEEEEWFWNERSERRILAELRKRSLKRTYRQMEEAYYGRDEIRILIPHERYMDKVIEEEIRATKKFKLTSDLNGTYMSLIVDSNDEKASEPTPRQAFKKVNFTFGYNK